LLAGAPRGFDPVQLGHGNVDDQQIKLFAACERIQRVPSLATAVTAQPASRDIFPVTSRTSSLSSTTRMRAVECRSGTRSGAPSAAASIVAVLGR